MILKLTTTKAGLEASSISFQSTGESEFVSLLLDGNRTVYPLVKDCTSSADSIRDPVWLDLPPVAAVGLGTHALPHVQEFILKLNLKIGQYSKTKNILFYKVVSFLSVPKDLANR